VISLPPGPIRRARVVLPPGPLLASATAALAPLGWPSATVQLLGGPLARGVFTCSVLTPGGPPWIDYGPRRDLGACWFVMGSLTFGPALDGTPALHCHAMLADAEGRTHGGHIVPDATALAAPGLVGWAVSTPAASFRIVRDVSTFNLLHPVAA